MPTQIGENRAKKMLKANELEHNRHRSKRSCPSAWCRSAGSPQVSGGSGRLCQAATAGSLTKGSSLNGAMVSSVM